MFIYKTYCTKCFSHCLSTICDCNVFKRQRKTQKIILSCIIKHYDQIIGHHLEKLLVQWYLKTCSRIRDKPTDLEIIKARGGTGNSRDIDLGSGQGKSDCTYKHAKY